MTGYREGDTVGIRCRAGKDPFPHGHLISLETMDGEMEGFVQESQLKEGADGWWQVRGVVNRVETGFPVVRVWGNLYAWQDWPDCPVTASSGVNLMVLPEPDLRAAVKTGEISFNPPIEDDQFGPASIDLRPGYSFSVLQQAPGMTIAPRNGLNSPADRNLWIEKRLEHADLFCNRVKFVVEKDKFILASTSGRVSISDNPVAMVEGRSTCARAGLSMHQPAPWIQPGWEGHIRPGIRNSGPWSIDLLPRDERPCQLAFMRLTSAPAKGYGAGPTNQYQGQTDTLPGGGKSP